MFDEALQKADEGYRDSAPDPAWNWKFRTLKAEILLRKGLPKEALSLLADQPAHEVPAGIVARKRIIQGQALCYLNRVAEALAVLNEAQSDIPSVDPVLNAELAFERGMCAFSSDPQSAGQYFEQAAKLARAHDSFIAASALLGSGYLLLRGGHCSDAIPKFNDVLSITYSLLLRERTLGNLAVCYAELGDWRQSISFADQAEKLAAKIKNDADREKWLIDLGRAHLAIHEFPSAEPHFVAALAIARARKDEDGISRCLNDLIQLALKRNDSVAAEIYWKEESALKVGADRRVYVTFDEAAIAIQRKEFAKAEGLLREILSSRTNDTLRLGTQRVLGEVYWRENKIAEADRTLRKAIDGAEALIKTIPPQHRMAFLDVDEFYDSYMRFLAEQDKPLEALRVAERGRAQILSQAPQETREAQSGLDLKKIQADLKKRAQIVLAYSLTDEESFLWTITPTQFKLSRLPSHVALHLQVDAFTTEIDHHRRLEESPAGKELYKSLIARAETLIPKGSHVVIISSKILSLVSFESLIVPTPQPHYWIEDVEIETASSLALLGRSRPTAMKSARKKKQLLLLGAPLEADKNFPFLPNASDEMNRVRGHFPANQETVISGKDAVPQSYRASNPGDYRFIHIDAHSAASELNPLKSFVVLSPTPDRSYKLFADEITETPLRADLVTLSACYGAGTRWYQGEGIVGLGWAFLRAGAHQVVASLWTVDDASTPQLMDDFYGELSKGKSAAEALRTAKLKMLHSTGPNSRPFYWASLQLYTGS